MTVAGAKALEVELLRLKDVERPRIVNDIATAREHGDLKENAEYHAAKDDQGFIEGRIQEIESKLSRMQLIDVTQLTQDGRCVFGTTILKSTSGIFCSRNFSNDSAFGVSSSAFSIGMKPIVSSVTSTFCCDDI